MEITGRITKDAVASELKNEKHVVNFTIAINDYFRPKNSNETKKVTTYVNCSYWLNSKVAERLSKGTLVELSGRIGVNAYTTDQGEAKASLTLHVNSIKVHGRLAPSTQSATASSINNNEELQGATVTEPLEDLPF